MGYRIPAHEGLVENLICIQIVNLAAPERFEAGVICLGGILLPLRVRLQDRLGPHPPSNGGELPWHGRAAIGVFVVVLRVGQI